MIQRIQSVYLFLVILFSGIIVFFVNLWDGQEISTSVLDLLNSQNFYFIVLAVTYLVIAILALISLLSFKKRLVQLRINRVNIVLNFILFGLLILNLLKLPGEFIHSLKGIGIWLTLGSIVFLFLANRAIQKDENLVKSVDRIR